MLPPHTIVCTLLDGEKEKRERHAKIKKIKNQKSKIEKKPDLFPLPCLPKTKKQTRRRRLPPPPPPPVASSSVPPPSQQHQSHHTRPHSSTNKPLNTLQRIAARNEHAKEQAARARLEALEAAAVRREQAAAAGARRKEQTALLRKKTHRGQPVMKYRMEGILSKLAAESAMSGGGRR